MNVPCYSIRLSFKHRNHIFAAPLNSLSLTGSSDADEPELSCTA